MSKLKRLLCMALTVLVLMSRIVLPASAEGEEIPLTWEEYIAANNITDWNWNDAADAIEKVARHAVELYKQGDLDNAYTYAKATYWGYYETTGFERNTMTRIAGRVSQVELAFTNLRNASIEVSAITTPDNELAVRAAKDPKSLSAQQYETWYCTAYVSSICFQIQEVITDAVASPLRQVADSEGAILEKTELLMLLITVLALVGSALGISNLVTASVMERSNEIGLMKAIGASDRAVTGLVLTEIVIVGIVGGVIGYFAGFGFAQVIGQSVFGSAIEMKPMVIPLVAVLVVAVTLLGSIPAVRTLLRLDPTVVLHGR